MDPPEIPTLLTEQRNYLSCIEEMFKRKIKLTENVVCDIGGGFFNSRGVSHHMTIGYSPCHTRAMLHRRLLHNCQAAEDADSRDDKAPRDSGRQTPPSLWGDREKPPMHGGQQLHSDVAKIVERVLWTMNITKKLMEGVYDDGVEAMPWQDLKLEMQPSCASRVKRKRVARGK